MLRVYIRKRERALCNGKQLFEGDEGIVDSIRRLDRLWSPLHIFIGKVTNRHKTFRTDRRPRKLLQVTPADFREPGQGFGLVLCFQAHPAAVDFAIPDGATLEGLTQTHAQTSCKFRLSVSCQAGTVQVRGKKPASALPGSSWRLCFHPYNICAWLCVKRQYVSQPLSTGCKKLLQT